MKKFLKYTFITISSLIGSIVFVALLIWFFPDLVVTPKTVRWVAGKQSFIQFEPGFPTSFDITVHNSNIFHQKIHLKASDFCIHTSNHAYHACFNNLDVSTSIDFSHFNILFESIGPIVVDAPNIEIDGTVPNQKKNKAQVVAKKAARPLFSKELNLQDVRIQMPVVTYLTERSTMKGSIQIEGHHSEQSFYDFTLLANATSDKDPKIMRIDLKSTMNPTYDLDGTIFAHVGTPGKKPNVDLNSKFSGNLVQAQGQIVGQIQVGYLTGFVPKIGVEHFKIEKSDKLSVDADFTIEATIGFLDNPRKSALPAPEFLSKLSGKLNAEQSGQDPFRFNVHINPLDQHGLIISSDTKGSFDKKTSELNLEKLLFSAKIPDFKKLVRSLRMTQLAVPAPINEMDGSIEIVIGDENISKSPDGIFSIPVKFNSSLRSQQQSLVIVSSGASQIKLSPFSGNLKLDVGLNDISLQMPGFDPVGKIPHVIGDKRFVRKEDDIDKAKIFAEEEKKKPTKPSAFGIEINITTPQKPIRIFYKLFKPSAIFRVNTTIKSNVVNYSLKFEPFDVSFMKRTARLLRLDLASEKDGVGILLDGRFMVKKADYDLFADIHEENKKTTIVLSSTPPLPEDDIISLILFNELATDLDSTSADSVENTESAMTKRSIGFFSFFVLASTPVESVTYDSATQQYSARVRLPGGFTGTVGSDWDKAQEVGIRRTFGGHWAIEATTGTDSEGNQTQESMLQWYNRY